MSAKDRLTSSDFRFWSAKGNTPEQTKELIWQRIESASKRITERTRMQREVFLHQSEMYGSTQMAGLSPQNYAAASSEAYSPSTLSFNVIRRTVDAIVAKIAKNKPLPLYLSIAGDPSQQARAKKRNGFISGAFYETQQYKRSRMVARDAAVWGTGLQSNFIRNGKLCSERVFPWELRVDPNEAMYGTPRTIYQYRWVDRYVLADIFPDHADFIENEAQTSDEDEQYIGYDTTADQLLVKEAWHLRSGDGAEDGMHAAVIEGKTLLSESYERDYFPFSKLVYKEPLMGYFGTGIAQELQGIQFEINAMAEKIQEGYLTTGSFWWLPEGSKVLTSHLENGLGTVVRTTGETPTKYDPPGISPDTMQYLEMLRQSPGSETGLSADAASGEKPAGVTAAVAIEKVNDIESEGFVLFGQGFEEFHLDVARQYIDLAREVDGYKVKSVKGKTYDIITVEDCKFPSDDSFILQAFPTSQLANTPSDRLQQIEDYANAGYITPDKAKELLDLPDTEAEMAMATAAHRVLMMWLQDMVDDPKAVHVPESLMNFADALPTAIQFYWLAYDQKQPEDALERLRNFIAQLQELAHPPPAQQAPNAAPGALMSGGVVAPGAPVPVMPGPAAPPPMPPPVVS